MFPVSMKTRMTAKSYHRFSMTLGLRRKLLWGIFLTVEFFLIASGLTSWVKGQYGDLPVILCFILLFPVYIYLILYFQAKRIYKKNPVFHDLEQELVFDETEIRITAKRGQTTYSYEDLVEIIETKQEFYLMLGSNVGIIVEKADCSPELIAFLLDLKSKTKRKKKSPKP